MTLTSVSCYLYPLHHYANNRLRGRLCHATMWWCRWQFMKMQCYFSWSRWQYCCGTRCRECSPRTRPRSSLFLSRLTRSVSLIVLLFSDLMSSVNASVAGSSDRNDFAAPLFYLSNWWSYYFQTWCAPCTNYAMHGGGHVQGHVTHLNFGGWYVYRGNSMR